MESINGDMIILRPISCTDSVTQINVLSIAEIKFCGRDKMCEILDAISNRGAFHIFDLFLDKIWTHSMTEIPTTKTFSLCYIISKLIEMTEKIIFVLFCILNMLRS